MRALIQRVTEASVEIDASVVGSIGPGLLVLLGIFSDDANRFNHSVMDAGGEILVVSQFTLYADTRRGRRPDFTRAAPPDLAERLYEHTVSLLRETGVTAATGRFQAYMQVKSQNDGPVTIMLDSADRHRPRH